MTRRPGQGRAACGAWAAAVVAAAVTAALAGCMSRTPAGRLSPAAALPRGRTVWLVTRAALAQLVTDPSVRAELGGSPVYEIVQPGQQAVPGITATPVVTFPSVAGLADALAADQMPAGTRAVLYDPEAWPFTPQAEQRDPVRAAARAASLAHAHGLQLIVSPALNLAAVLSSGGTTAGNSAARWQRFLDLRLAAEIAKAADVIDLQAQSLERSAASYAAFVREAASQARSAKPGVTVLAGLSTNPPGAIVTSQQLVAAVEATRPDIDGYWLNIPSPGPRCPTCNPARPDVGIDALKAVL